jgi:hypothetical protein
MFPARPITLHDASMGGIWMLHRKKSIEFGFGAASGFLAARDSQASRERLGWRPGETHDGECRAG